MIQPLWLEKRLEGGQALTCQRTYPWSAASSFTTVAPLLTLSNASNGVTCAGDQVTCAETKEVMDTSLGYPNVIRPSSHVSGCECSSGVDLCADTVKLVHQSLHLAVSLSINLYSAPIIQEPPNNNPNAQGHLHLVCPRKCSNWSSAYIRNCKVLA